MGSMSTATLTSDRCDYDYYDIIAVLVGPEEHRFRVHKDVICAKSKFFRAACSSCWREGQEKVVRLPNARSEQSFQTYIYWIYASDVVVDEITSSEVEEKVVSDLIELFLLGDVLDDVKLRNEVIQLLTTHIQNSDDHLTADHCKLIWDHTTSNSTLRKWTVEAIVTSMHAIYFESDGASWPTDLALRIAIHFMHKREDDDTDLQLEKRLRSCIEMDADA
jgi:hypothetical protein